MNSNIPAAPSCDRQCLINLADSYLAALVAHDASRVPLAVDVKIVENAKRIKAGEGLWKTTTAGASADYKVVVPDTVSQQVGGIVMTQAEGKPAHARNQHGEPGKVASGHTHGSAV